MSNNTFTFHIHDTTEHIYQWNQHDWNKTQISQLAEKYKIFNRTIRFFFFRYFPKIDFFFNLV